jgi:hypothetical protein
MEQDAYLVLGAAETVVVDRPTAVSKISGLGGKTGGVVTAL